MKNDHGVDAFYFHDKLGQVLRDLGSYKADELARALCRLAKVADENVLKEPEFAQHPAMAVPDGWKLVPFHATREQVNAVFMHPDLARTLYRNMVEAAPAAPVAQEPVAIEVMQFQLKHPDSGETHTVELTRDEVADGMADTLYEKLSPMVCQCNGDADHECGDYIHDFDLVADPPAAEQTECSGCRALSAEIIALRTGKTFCGACRDGCHSCEVEESAPPAAEQPDTVKVSREDAELLAANIEGMLCNGCTEGSCCMPDLRAGAEILRALLAGGEQ